ncbi:MAG: T9SS type A sorting domain-containing protein [Chitinophagaceae bacterium]|nr:T9SS type A sorting domain-containing protein [Chitinophagaceae bacterium]
MGWMGNANSKIIFRGNLTLGRRAFVNVSNTPGTIEFDGSGSQTITWNNTSYYCEFTNVVIGNTNNPTVNIVTGSAAPDNILGNLTLNGTSVLNLGTSRWNGGTSGGGTGNAGSLTLNGNAVLQLGNNTGGHSGSNFPMRFNTVSISNTSLVEYNVTSGQTIYNLPSPGYGHLSINNGTKSAGANLEVRGSLEIKSGSTFNAGSYTHSIGGNWINDGSFNAGTGTIQFNGSGAQSISGSVSTTFNHFTINKAAGALTLNRTTSISGTGTFTAGIVNSTAANLLLFNDNATATGANNGTNPSFVNGPVRKIGNDAFVFPVGKTGAGYRFCSISAPTPSNVDDVFTAEYMRASAAAMGPMTSTGLSHVSNCEYWNITEDGPNSPTTNITISWSGYSNCNTAAYVTDLSTLVMAQLGVAGWDNHGSSSTSGTVSSGSITWNSLSSFGNFALGSTNGATNPLPVKLVNVKAYVADAVNQIEWTNLTESGIVSYSVQRSVNGQQFTTIGSLPARSQNGGREDFKLTDLQPLLTGYYRIQVIEISGKTTYSPIVKVQRNLATLGIAVYPNPVQKGQSVQLQLTAEPGQYELSLFETGGRLVKKEMIQHRGNTMTQSIELPATLPAGQYFLKLTGSFGTRHTSIVIR